MKRLLVLWGPVVAYMAALFFVSSLSDVPGPPSGFSDKHEHFVFYAVLGALALRALAGGRWQGVTIRTLLGAILIAAAYGVSDEVHQWFVPGRDADPLDAVADTAGAATAAAAAWAWSIIRRRSGTRHVV